MIEPGPSKATTTLTTATHREFFRGDMLRFQYGDAAPTFQRVTFVRGPTLTVRKAHGWSVLESAHFAFERCILWPLADARRWLAKVRVTVKM